MAASPGHRLGQLIGGLFETSVRELLAAIAEEHGLYLDYHHSRKARGGKKHVVWKDSKGNTHILDYVIEEGGSEIVQGRPRAFIEVAWRRYTKHSKNKAQEIQGAITPLAETYRNSQPFLGVALAGEFTEPSLDQFRSHHFNLIYCSYDTVIEAFASEGVDVSSEENTSEVMLQRKVDAVERLSSSQLERIATRIRESHSEQFRSFFDSLRNSLRRSIECVVVLALSGTPQSFATIQDAVKFISNHDPDMPASVFVKYELNVRYSNGDEIRCTFHNKDTAIEFLSLYLN